MEDHVRRCDLGLMVIPAFGKNGAVGVIRRELYSSGSYDCQPLCLPPPPRSSSLRQRLQLLVIPLHFFITGCLHAIYLIPAPSPRVRFLLCILHL